MFRMRSLRLYCFSPLVMVLTFLVEIGAALWVLFRYRTNKIAQLIIALLVLLGTFQLAEYMVCEGAFGLSSLDWAKLGYMAITLLPPLGLHLGMTIARRKYYPLLVAAYGTAALFIIFFVLVGYGIDSQVCMGNYVILSLIDPVSKLYGLYYYGWLLASIGLAWHWRATMKDAHRKKALAWLVAGYGAFIIPTTLVNLVDRSTAAGIPSIMCGFAVILALILLLRVSPLMLEKRR